MPGQNEIQAEKAMKRAMKHERDRHRKPKRVDKPETKGPNDKGIDIRSKGRTIEVKGSRDKNRMIPDAHGNEFVEVNGELKLVADYLYLVRFKDGKAVGFYRLSREEVGRYHHEPIQRVRFASSLGTDLRNGVFPNRLREGNPERVDSKAPPGPTEMERLRIELAERERQ